MDLKEEFFNILCIESDVLRESNLFVFASKLDPKLVEDQAGLLEIQEDFSEEYRFVRKIAHAIEAIEKEAKS